MQQIADWLKKLDMSEYAERFAERDIDIDVLSELTDHDFDRLGVSLGHRRKMLRAIRELSASPITASTERQASAPTVPEPAPKDAAERRQVTVISATSWAQRPYRRAWTLSRCVPSEPLLFDRGAAVVLKHQH
jgi:hypothetical protein